MESAGGGHCLGEGFLVSILSSAHESSTWLPLWTAQVAEKRAQKVSGSLVRQFRDELKNRKMVRSPAPTRCPPAPTRCPLRVVGPPLRLTISDDTQCGW
jgi:hypothetical protein